MKKNSSYSTTVPFEENDIPEIVKKDMQDNSFNEEFENYFPNRHNTFNNGHNPFELSRPSIYSKKNKTFNLSTTTEKKRVSNAMKRFEQMKTLYEQEGIIQRYISKVPNIYKILTKHNIDGGKQASWISQSKGYWEWLKQQRGNKSINEYKKENGLSTMALRAQYLEELMAGTFTPTNPNGFDKQIQNSINQYVRRHNTKQNSLYSTASLSSNLINRY